MPLYLSSEARHVLESHAERSYPEECCGLIFGKEVSAHQREVHMVFPVENSEKTNRRMRFQVSAETLLQAHLEAQKRDLDVVGLYHSHPDQASTASESDRIHAMPSWSYLIVSCMNGKCERIQSWLLREDKSVFDEETIHHTT